MKNFVLYCAVSCKGGVALCGVAKTYLLYGEAVFHNLTVLGYKNENICTSLEGDMYYV